jgi:hypothetical protein
VRRGVAHTYESRVLRVSLLEVFLAWKMLKHLQFQSGSILTRKRILSFKNVLQHFISSSELKAQVSFSDRPLPIVCLLDFYIFYFSRTTGPILTNNGTNHPLG